MEKIKSNRGKKNNKELVEQYAFIYKKALLPLNPRFHKTSGSGKWVICKK